MAVIACVKPVPLGEPRVARGQLVTEGLPWGLPPGERRVVAAGLAAARALGADLVALALGTRGAGAGLREALALGARRAVLLDAGERRLDALATARALAAAVRRLGGPHCVLAGGESADAQQGLLGPMLAELLGLDLLAGVERLEGAGGDLVAVRVLDGERERVAARPPLVLAVSPGFEPAPHATSWGLGEAYARPLEAWPLERLGLPAQALEPGSDLVGLAGAERRAAGAQVVEGEPEEAADQLLRRLRRAGVVP